MWMIAMVPLLAAAFTCTRLRRGTRKKMAAWKPSYFQPEENKTRLEDLERHESNLSCLRLCLHALAATIFGYEMATMLWPDEGLSQRLGWLGFLAVAVVCTSLLDLWINDLLPTKGEQEDSKNDVRRKTNVKQ